MNEYCSSQQTNHAVAEHRRGGGLRHEICQSNQATVLPNTGKGYDVAKWLPCHIGLTVWYWVRIHAAQQGVKMWIDSINMKKVI